jgi:hypothetical protein
MSAAIYPCETAEDARKAVYSVAFQAMRWLYWYEIADRLRYVAIDAYAIDAALIALQHEGAIERTTAGDGRYIYRVTLN